jgi:hypothetical protein
VGAATVQEAGSAALQWYGETGRNKSLQYYKTVTCVCTGWSVKMGAIHSHIRAGAAAHGGKACGGTDVLRPQHRREETGP